MPTCSRSTFGIHGRLSFFNCSSNGKGDPNQQGFGQALLKALLDNMPYLPAAATGGNYGLESSQIGIFLFRTIFTVHSEYSENTYKDQQSKRNAAQVQAGQD